MNDTPHRIKASIGGSQFEADGTDGTVTALFQAWVAAVSQSGSAGNGHAPAPINGSIPATSNPAGEPVHADTVFRVDEKRNIVSLNGHPPAGEHRDADAALMVLYGFRRLLQQDEVMVGRLKGSLADSGLAQRETRIDRVLGDYVTSNFVHKVGRSGPGAKYRLTNTGHARAEALVRGVAEQLAIP